MVREDYAGLVRTASRDYSVTHFGKEALEEMRPAASSPVIRPASIPPPEGSR